jgi:hypothetical protein
MTSRNNFYWFALVCPKPNFSPYHVLLPGVEEFQIIGEPKPGFTLRVCGFPINGTKLCIFQVFTS